MIRINNAYSYSPQEIAKINANPPHEGGDWNESIFDSIKKNIKEHLLLEQNRICPYCGLKLPKWGMYPHIEHVVHKKVHYRFMFEPKNLIVTCQTCNINKGEKETLINPITITYPSTGNDFLIIQPYFDDYFQHIELICDILLRALTSKGSKTIEYCRLNSLPLAEERMEQLKISMETTYKKMTLQLIKENDLLIKQQILDFLNTK